MRYTSSLLWYWALRFSITCTGVPVNERRCIGDVPSHGSLYFSISSVPTWSSEPLSVSNRRGRCPRDVNSVRNAFIATWKYLASFFCSAYARLNRDHTSMQQSTPLRVTPIRCFYSGKCIHSNMPGFVYRVWCSIFAGRRRGNILMWCSLFVAQVNHRLIVVSSSNHRCAAQPFLEMLYMRAWFMNHNAFVCL